MPLRIETFRNDIGGSSIYKAVSHPLAAEPARALIAKLAGAVAVYDPDGIIEAFDQFYPLDGIEIGQLFVQNVEHLERSFRGRKAEPVTALSTSPCKSLLIASFDEAKLLGHIRHLVPRAMEVLSFAPLRLPADMLTDKARYLSNLNFATNFAFFRDADGHHTRLVTANYWTRYGAREVRLWCRLFDGDGKVLATWIEEAGQPEASIVLDSRAVRARFALPEFTGQLFVHAIGVAGHDIVKYALDTYGDAPTVLSATHDANSWPSDLYAGLPAPADGEDVILWAQNSHPITIASGEIGLARMGNGAIARLNETIASYATRAIKVSELLPDLRWPEQVEIHAGKHFVRPRYEVLARNGRSRIAHPNVERSDLKSDPKLAKLGDLVGKGHILPAAILPVERYATTALPTPMSTAQTHMPVKALVYDADGTLLATHAFGNLARDHADMLDVSRLANFPRGFGHLELVYDFDAGDVADGWLHALFRYRDLSSGHQAETSFGSHIFNIALTYKGEPQSYSGPPPGLTTRLFLRVAPGPARTFCHLVYPSSASWHPRSKTSLTLRDTQGKEVAHNEISIAQSGSHFWHVEEMFDAAALKAAGPNPYVIIRDETCRLFGYHGVEGQAGSFSLDHMFGF
ncbi:MAG TPA: hypothetical protein VMD53_11100 [Rhizomicrobium sp.]|nr:hypothetical protein [Rhizomicrobium sp.]